MSEDELQRTAPCADTWGDQLEVPTSTRRLSLIQVLQILATCILPGSTERWTDTEFELKSGNAKEP